MMPSSGSRWYVVHTQPHSENKAAMHLARQGFVAYLPRYSKRRRHARRIETVTAPLFPRYLFVSIDRHTQRWRSIYSTIGVSQLVSAGDDPVAVSDDVIRSLRAREDAAGLIQLERRPSFRIGDKVLVMDGVFSDRLGLYDGMTDGERIAVLLDLLGRKVRVVLDMDYVAAG
jgi:transcriptional antiterminator RfaH